MGGSKMGLDASPAAPLDDPLGTFSLRFNPVLHCGAGTVQRVPELLRGLAGETAAVSGRREDLRRSVDSLPVLLVMSRSAAASPAGEALAAGCREAGLEPEVRTVHGEPTPETVDALAGEFRGAGLTAVAAVGGGSVLDTGKAAAAMIGEGTEAGGASVKEFLEGVGSRKPTGRTLPLLAVPTTAGTGSEATKNAVISEPGPEGFKKSLRHNSYVPRAAVVDPDLSAGLPLEVRAASALDALSQLLEAYLSTGITSPVEVLILDGLAGMAPALDCMAAGFSLASDSERDRRGRAGLAYGAYVSGLALANAGLGSVHGLAGPLGGLCSVPHGAACGLLLPPVMEKVLAGLDREGPEAGRLEALAAVLGTSKAPETPGTPRPRGEDIRGFLVDRLYRWRDSLPLPRLGQYGLTRDDCRRAAELGGNKKSPVSLDAEDFHGILRDLL